MKKFFLVLALLALLQPTVIAESQTVAGPAFWESFLIITREGLEAILIIGAIIAYLLAAKQGGKTRVVYVWSAAAIVASLLTAFIVDQVFKTNGAQLEVLEGFTMLLAAIVLLYVTNWLLGKIDSKKWTEYIKGKVWDALSSENTLAIGLVSFLAVYREGFETVLFYNALAISSQDPIGIIAGLLLGIVVLAILFVLIIKIGAKLPLGIAFGATSTLLFILSVKFAGKGIHELQEAGIVGETTLNVIPKIKDLGLYPTLETLGIQAIILLFGAAMLYIHFKQGKGAAAG